MSAPAIVAEAAVVGLLVLPPRRAAVTTITGTVVGLFSLVATLWFVQVPGGGTAIGPLRVSHGYLPYTEAFGLLALIVMVVRRVPAVQAIIAGSVLTVAAAALWLKVMGDIGYVVAWPDVTLLGCVMWSRDAIAAAVIGGVLRRLDRRKRRETAEARRMQRLRFAGELRDLVADDIAGMVDRARRAQRTIGLDPAAAQVALHWIEQAGQDALCSVDTVVHMLHDGHPDRASTVAALVPSGAAT